MANEFTKELGLRSKRKVKGRVVASGEDLFPDLEDQAVVKKGYFYWVGAIPSCPVERVDLAGIDFPKINELIIDDPTRTGLKKRVPVIGSIVKLDKEKVEQIRERLKRTIIRFLSGEKENMGGAKDLKDLHKIPRRGHLITIPTKEEIEARKKAGKPINKYIPREHDEPAAKYLFAVLCGDQEKPERGDYYPDTLDKTGLVWPDD